MDLFTQQGSNAQGREPGEQLETCLSVGRILFVGRRYRECLALIEPAITSHPSNVPLLHLRGLCLQAMNNQPAAFATFMSVVSLDAKHIPSLCAIGSMYKNRGMLQEAMAAYQQALDASAPGTQLDIRLALSGVYIDLGNKIKGSGGAQEALSCYQKAVELCPASAAAHYHLGVLYSELKQMDLALASYRQAVQLCPTYAEAHCNMGVICKEHGDLEGAIACYERALEAAPNFAIVKSNLAIALTDQGTRVKIAGRLREGIALYERALTYNPRYADALYNLGVAHGEAGEIDRAIFMYEVAVQCNPACAEAYNNLGVIYKERDNLERAMECYTAALTVKPDFPQSLNNMGVILTCQGRAQEALTLLTAAITACPSYAEAHNNLGVLQRDVGAIPQALASYTTCLDLCPDSRNAGQNRLLALNYIRYGDEQEVCRAHAEWGRRFASLFKPLPPLGPADRDLSCTRPLRVGYLSPDFYTHSVSYFAEAPLTHHYTPKRHREATHILLSAAETTAATTAMGAAQPPLLPAGAPLTPCVTEEDSILVHSESSTVENSCASGGVSPSDRSASTTPGGATQQTLPGTLVAQQSTRHIGAVQGGMLGVSHAGCGSVGSEPRIVQHFAYCCAPKRDGKSARLKAAVLASGGVWREVTQLSEEALAALVRQDEIDILVELTGHTANNRLGVMALRPAPVQVTWIGYPNSTGLESVDYRITDEYADPWDTKQTYVEQLVRMPGGTFLCYTPSPDAPAVAPAPAESAGYVTFGSFNNLAKITPEVLEVWAQILKAVPRSRLVLKNKPFACDTARMHILNQFVMQGVDSWRVDLLPLAASNVEHLATYAQMDISLDTFPYAGTTTTCESLYMGVPCLTLGGRGHAHNVGVSLVTSVGLQEEWIAYSKEQYVAMAVTHATDVPRLAGLRRELRQRMLNSRLCTAGPFVRELEGIYHDMWVKHVNTVKQTQEATADTEPATMTSQPATDAAAGAAAPTQPAAPAGRRSLDAMVRAKQEEGVFGADVTAQPSPKRPATSAGDDGCAVAAAVVPPQAAQPSTCVFNAVVSARSSTSRPSSPGTPGLEEEQSYGTNGAVVSGNNTAGAADASNTVAFASEDPSRGAAGMKPKAGSEGLITRVSCQF